MRFLCQLIQKLQPEQTQTDRHTHTDRHTDTHIETDTQTHTHRHAHTDRHTDMTKTLPLPHTREVISTKYVKILFCNKT